MRYRHPMQSFAYRIEPDRPAERVPLDAAVDPADGFVWMHFDGPDQKTPDLLKRVGIGSFVHDALMAPETRPRCTVQSDAAGHEGALINLRGVNLDPEAEPEDMVSVRLWVTDRRVITVTFRTLGALADMCQGIERGTGAQSPGGFVARLALRLADRAEPTVAHLNERMDDLEDRAEDGERVPRRDLSDLRRASIVLRRFMVPQRDALTTLEIEDLDWLDMRDRTRIREAADRVTRLGEELDAIRDRAQVIHDEIMDDRAERMNKQMLVLAVITAVFLPLGLLAGMLGMNVGGVPLANDPHGFWWITGAMAVLGVIQWAVFHFVRLR